MTLINRKEIAQLAEMQDAFCVSIFIPTHRSGQAVLKKSDAILLKNQVKAVTEKLEKEGMSELEIAKFMKPAHDLIQDSGFWSNQSDGLAIYMAKDFFRKYTLPIKFEEFNYVANGFYLKPLMPLFSGDGRFFVLTLEIEAVKFYEATRHAISDVIIKDLVPSRLEEVVGFDYEQKSLQFRTQQMGSGNAAFHGHGEGKAERKDEILRFFRSVNKGLMTMLHDESAPMVVACQDFLFPIYKEANTYKNLMDDHISSNPANLDKLLLHEKAWAVVQPFFDRERLEKLELSQQHHDTKRTSIDIREIVPAALEGKIEALFLKNSEDIWGIYNPTTREVRVQEMPQSPNVSLLNLAATKTFLQGGKVYLLENDEMPTPYSKVNALYRY